MVQFVMPGIVRLCEFKRKPMQSKERHSAEKSNLLRGLAKKKVINIDKRNKYNVMIGKIRPDKKTLTFFFFEVLTSKKYIT